MGQGESKIGQRSVHIIKGPLKRLKQSEARDEEVTRLLLPAVWAQRPPHSGPVDFWVAKSLPGK